MSHIAADGLRPAFRNHQKSEPGFKLWRMVAPVPGTGPHLLQDVDRLRRRATLTNHDLNSVPTNQAGTAPETNRPPGGHRTTPCVAWTVDGCMLHITDPIRLEKAVWVPLALSGQTIDSVVPWSAFRLTGPSLSVHHE
jgi:hypothetical protein